MIKPTVARLVHYWPGGRAQAEDPGKQPLAAKIAFVYGERLINIGYLKHDGTSHNATSVPLIQDGDERPEHGFCEWMPFQKGQATRTEAAEAKLAATTEGRDAELQRAANEGARQPEPAAIAELQAGGPAPQTQPQPNPAEPAPADATAS